MDDLKLQQKRSLKTAPIPIKVVITVTGDRLIADFTGSASQVRGAINSPLPFTKSAVYAGLIALAVNLLVAVVVTFILRAMKVDDGVDATAETDYTAAREDPTVRDLPDPLASEPPGVSARRTGVRSVSNT